MDTLSPALVILLILWMIGFIGSYTFGGLIHLLLLVVVIVLIIRLIRGEALL